jgi:hydroxylamine reductase
MNMFCYQCQETSMERGCRYFGACGKTEETANLQDLLIYILRGIAFCAEPGFANGRVDRETGLFICRALFSTITNTNFDPARFIAMIREGIALRDRLLQQHRDALPEPAPESALWSPENDQAIDMKSLTIDIRNMKDPDMRSIREFATYGMKGAAAYAFHSAVLGFHEDAVYRFLVQSLAAMNRSQTEVELEQMAIETGKIMIAAMALLDRANVETYGVPQITNIQLGVRENPGILVTGHDLKDLEELLEQTMDSGIDIYTHSEMWAAHQYPFFKKFPHLAGNYGNAWWMQDIEFASFNGPILVTSNCIIPTAPAYQDRIYTTGVAGYPGIPHIADALPEKQKDFSQLISRAKGCVPPKELESGSVLGGFSHYVIAPILDKVVAAVLSGKIKRFVVMGGCDGRDSRREYFTKIAQSLPHDTIILSAGCAKYRFIKMDLGNIEGIPRVLDAGQCNDCYSLVRIALALQKATGAESINDLPIALDIAWYDQKAVGVVLALAALGVRRIRIGPGLPAFLQSDGGRRFMQKYDIFATGTVESDLAAICSIEK